MVYFVTAHPEVLSEDYLPDDRYNHIQQVSERLRFLRFILKDGHLWLCAPQAIQIWNCLAINAVYSSDREACFKWFTKVTRTFLSPIRMHIAHRRKHFRSYHQCLFSSVIQT